MDDGRAVPIPGFLFFCPCPIRFTSLSEYRPFRRRTFPACSQAFSARFPIFMSSFGLFLSVSGFAVFLSGFFDAVLRLPALSACSRSFASAVRSPAFDLCCPISGLRLLLPGLPFYLFAALPVRNRRWILPMPRSSEDCPAMSVQHIDTHCIYSCIAAVWAGCVSDCAGSSMLPNC